MGIVVGGTPVSQVVVKLRDDVAASIADSYPSQAGASGPAADVAAVLGQHGAHLAVMHPGTTDPDLKTWFIAEVADEPAATRLAAILRGLDGIEAAYEQRPAEPP
jgi:hypothetical protein